MAKGVKEEHALTASGYEYDKELARVSIKVIPALQALIANQHDLTEAVMSLDPEKKIFIEMHSVELSVVEDTISQAYARYRARKEEARKMKLEKEENSRKSISAKFDDVIKEKELPAADEVLKDQETIIDEMASKLSPGLPSARYGERKAPAVKNEIDVRRIAVGASIKALSNFLGRDLTDEEMRAIEKQVEAYL